MCPLRRAVYAAFHGRSSDFSDGNTCMHDAVAALYLAVGALLTLLLMSTPDCLFLDRDRAALRNPAAVSQREPSELMVALLEIAERRGAHAQLRGGGLLGDSRRQSRLAEQGTGKLPAQLRSNLSRYR